MKKKIEMEKTTENFDEWFDIFVDKCRELGYTGPIDRESVEWDFDGDTPEDAAREFVAELNS